MRLRLLHGVADGFVVWQMKNYRKSFIRNNLVKKISSEPDAVIKRATSGSRAIGSQPLFYCHKQNCEKITTCVIHFSVQPILRRSSLRFQKPLIANLF